MLLKFSVENYGPFKEETVLDFHPSKLKDSDSCIIEKDDTSALSVLGIFGMNASGKSYLLRALANLASMMRFPLPAAMPILAYAPFRLSSETRNAPTKMNLEFICEGERFEYTVEFDGKSILKESLDHFPNGQRAGVFKRDGNKITTPSGRFNEINSVSKLVSPNSTVVAVASQFNTEILQKIVRYLNTIFLVNPDLQASLQNVIKSVNEDPEIRMMVLDALSVADFGIDDIRGKISQVDLFELRNTMPSQMLGMMLATGNERVDQMTLHLIHHSSDPSLKKEDCCFDYTIESSGTLRMIAIIGPVIQALRCGGVVLIDEFGAFLDHDICTWMISLFRSPVNHRGAQLVFNSHDQMLINTEDLFRRDQIYISDKDPDSGESEIRPVSECSLRKDADVLKTYRAGKLGGRPYIVDSGKFNFHE